MMREQDEDVEALAQIVRRQKDMGLAIKDEVDRQIEYMDRMNEDVDRLAGKGEGGQEEDAEEQVGGEDEGTFGVSGSRGDPPPRVPKSESGSASAADSEADGDTRRIAAPTSSLRPLDAILHLAVRFILAGVYVVVVVDWAVRKTADGVSWLLELGLTLLQPP
ncbi:hypothetical protein VTK73DRAFT_10345 [Phialemonium thermophilum]|uniref:t-SNARE coiled-coil homology domain-containing protein n=1 Tax=Phialemonium thermophilum TaxID=223376 RepID=A0ABR3VX69_9PEZI